MIQNKIKFLLSSNFYAGEDFELGQKMGLFQVVDRNKDGKDDKTQWLTDNGTTHYLTGETQDQFKARRLAEKKAEAEAKQKQGGGGNAGGTGTGGSGFLTGGTQEEDKDFFEWMSEGSAGENLRKKYWGLSAEEKRKIKEAYTQGRSAEAAFKNAEAAVITAQGDRALKDAQAAVVDDELKVKEKDAQTQARKVEVDRLNALTDFDKAELQARYGLAQESYKQNATEALKDRETQEKIRDANLQKANDPTQERPKEQMFRMVLEDLPHELLPTKIYDIKTEVGTFPMPSIQYSSVDFSVYMFERESEKMQYFSEFAYYYIPQDLHRLDSFQDGKRLLNVDLTELSNKNQDVDLSDANNPKINKPRRVFAKRNGDDPEKIEYFFFLDEEGKEHKLSPEQRSDVYCKGDLITHPKLGNGDSLDNYMVQADEANKLWFHGSLPKKAQEKFDVLACILPDPFMRRSISDMLANIANMSFFEILIAAITIAINVSTGCLDRNTDFQAIIKEVNENPKTFSNLLSQLEGIPEAKTLLEQIMADPELMKSRKMNSVEFLEMKAKIYQGYLNQNGVTPAVAISQADDMFNKIISKFNPDTDALKAFNQYIVSDGKLSKEEARSLQEHLADEGITATQLLTSLSATLTTVNPSTLNANATDFASILRNFANLDGDLKSKANEEPTKDKNGRIIEVKDKDYSTYKITTIKTSVENVLSH
ncbi:MAG: hypothetical protein SFT90_03185 [Rickettsiales bacterium]|nr:hypothetical protein [Rickettsiales bacterium]